MTAEKGMDTSSMDFVEKKERLCELIEAYIEDPQKKEELLQYVETLREDQDFAGKELFESIFTELCEYLSELSRRELKQRILMIKSYFDA